MNYEYALFLGCTIPLKYPHFEKAFREISEVLNIKYKEMEGSSCCPDPVATQSLNVDTWLTIAARNLAIAEEMDLDIMTVCSGCYETLKTTKVLLERDKDAFDRVNSILNQINIKYKGTSDVFHFVELFIQDEMMDRIKENVVKPLDNLNIAAHYGCHLIRPSKVLQFDDPERPESMDKILELLGAKTVAFASKLECCGYCARLNEDIGMKLVKEKILDLKNLENKVDTMVAVCPACVSQYDKKERLLDRDTETSMNIPILYLPELMAIAFGIDTDKLDLKRRSVRPIKLLEKLKI